MTQVKALADLKVLEYSKNVTGPYCARLLGDMGAEVIKAEDPGKGDPCRNNGPFPGDMADPEKSALFVYLNNNKSGITLNPASELGLAIFYKLLKQADIFIEDMPARISKELKLDHTTLAELNPRLIVTSISPFGGTGPYRNYKGDELTTFQMSGVGYYTPGAVVDPEKEQPLNLRAHQVEFMAGMTAATATMFAVIQRQSSGFGQHIDLGIRDTVVPMGMWNYTTYFYTGQKPTRAKGGYLPRAPSNILPCKDGYIELMCLEDHHWQRFVEVIGNPEWAKIELFKTPSSRGEYWDALEPLLTEVTRQWETLALCNAAQAKRVPCTPVSTPKNLVNSDHLADRGFFVDFQHPPMGKVKLPGAPFKASETPWRLDRAAPSLGQDNNKIIGEQFGYSLPEMATMRKMGVI